MLPINLLFAEQQIEEANKRYGGFTNEFGKMVEDLCKPAALRISKTEGIDIDHTYEGSRRERAGEEEMEVDVLLLSHQRGRRCLHHKKKPATAGFFLVWKWRMFIRLSDYRVW